MTNKPNAFTSGPTLSWTSKPPKRPSLAPSHSGVVLGDKTPQAERDAVAALHQCKGEVIDKWKKQTKR